MTLQKRRTTALSPLAIVLPHPPLPRRSMSKSSLISSADPHTPRSCHSPSLSSLHAAVYYPTSNRKSSDSWNSSNADDMEYEWSPDQVLFLSRTLEALPAHLITPFHGPVPPSNLLDKIARSVAHAKGPDDWPHSIRATRVKLLDLARAKAREDRENAKERNRHLVIREEGEMEEGEDDERDPLLLRPVCRQSSMDFIKPGPEDIRGNAAIARLSKRLQRTDRLLAYQYHPYSRPKGSPTDSGTPLTNHTLKKRRSSSPPLPSAVPSLISPSTPSSSTLNSLCTASASGLPRGMRLRRSISTMSSVSLCGSADGALVDPRVERLKRSETLAASSSSVLPPIPPPKDAYGYALRGGLKRAPSYGAVKQEAKVDCQRKKEAAAVSMMEVVKEVKAPRHERKISSGSHVSSDEEEKSRSKRVKKLRTTPSRSSSSPVPSSPISVVMGSDTAPSSPRTPAKAREKASVVGVAESKNVEASLSSLSSSPRKLKAKAPSNRPSTRPVPMNLQRNPSMFGAELPPLPTVESLSGRPVTVVDVGGGKGKSKVGERVVKSLNPVLPAKAKVKSPPSSSPESPTTRTLRRVKRLDLGFGFGLGARKIEFGGLDGKGEQEGKKAGSRNMLESAIQLA